jgi:hypothetical protein
VSAETPTPLRKISPEHYHGSKQQQYCPAGQKEPATIDQDGINLFNIHGDLENLDSSGFELHFSGESFVILQNFVDRIQSAQRSQFSVSQGQFDLGQPAFYGHFHAVRHFSRDYLYEIGWHCR